ncbi:hypothetical protein RCH23_002112 [Cryobacterium sp. CAN_C3]|nr:hypothetical protein [Cryobacterium sp. CAN_C3]
MTSPGQHFAAAPDLAIAFAKEACAWAIPGTPLHGYPPVPETREARLRVQRLLADAAQIRAAHGHVRIETYSTERALRLRVLQSWPTADEITALLDDSDNEIRRVARRSRRCYPAWYLQSTAQ